MASLLPLLPSPPCNAPWAARPVPGPRLCPSSNTAKAHASAKGPVPVLVSAARGTRNSLGRTWLPAAREDFEGADLAKGASSPVAENVRGAQMGTGAAASGRPVADADVAGEKRGQDLAARTGEARDEERAQGAEEGLGDKVRGAWDEVLGTGSNSAKALLLMGTVLLSMNSPAAAAPAPAFSAATELFQPQRTVARSLGDSLTLPGRMQASGAGSGGEGPYENKLADELERTEETEEGQREALRRRAQETAALRTKLERASPLQVPGGAPERMERRAGERQEGAADVIKDTLEGAGGRRTQSVLPGAPTPHLREPIAVVARSLVDSVTISFRIQAPREPTSTGRSGGAQNVSASKLHPTEEKGEEAGTKESLRRTRDELLSEAGESPIDAARRGIEQAGGNVLKGGVEVLPQKEASGKESVAVSKAVTPSQGQGGAAAGAGSGNLLQDVQRTAEGLGQTFGKKNEEISEKVQDRAVRAADRIKRDIEGGILPRASDVTEGKGRGTGETLGRTKDELLSEAGENPIDAAKRGIEQAGGDVLKGGHRQGVCGCV